MKRAKVSNRPTAALVQMNPDGGLVPRPGHRAEINQCPVSWKAVVEGWDFDFPVANDGSSRQSGRLSISLR
jgi:hypothetical protein